MSEHMTHRPVYLLITRRDGRSYVEQRTTWWPSGLPEFVEAARTAQLKEGGTVAVIDKAEYDAARFAK